MRYKIVRCPNCGLFQVTGNSKTLICQRCSKTKVLSQLKIWYQNNDASLCAKVLAKLNEERRKKNENFSDDFESVI